MTDLSVTENQKLWVALAALERIKDAPISEAEMQQTAQDALHIAHYGFEDGHLLGHWGQSLYGHLPPRRT